ncbi:unnamed protein product, partial [Scytosiphon promiscuus]
SLRGSSEDSNRGGAPDGRVRNLEGDDDDDDDDNSSDQLVEENNQAGDGGGSSGSSGAGSDDRFGAAVHDQPLAEVGVGRGSGALEDDDRDHDDDHDDGGQEELSQDSAEAVGVVGASPRDGIGGLAGGSSAEDDRMDLDDEDE